MEYVTIKIEKAVIEGLKKRNPDLSVNKLLKDLLISTGGYEPYEGEKLNTEQLVHYINARIKRLDEKYEERFQRIEKCLNI